MDSELNIQAFDTIFNKYQQRFVRFANTYVSDFATAEDIVMESFAASWDNRMALSVESFPAYTMTTIKHKSLNYLRSKYIKSRAAADIHSHGMRMLATRISTLQACNPDELFSQEVQQLVNDAIASLPERTRNIFVRSRFQGQSYKQIALETNTSVKSVEFEISKAMKVLRVSLKDYLYVLIFWLDIK